MAKTTPPRAVPSILVKTIPVKGVIFEILWPAQERFDLLMHQVLRRFHAVLLAQHV